MNALTTYKTIVDVFLNINVVFVIGVDPSDTTGTFFKPMLSLKDPWKYGRRMRARIVSYPDAKESSFEIVVEKMTSQLVAQGSIVIYTWNRNDAEQVDKLTYIWDEQKKKFNAPTSEYVDLGENK